MNQSDNGSIASYLLQLMDRIRTDVSQRQAKLIDESSGQQTNACIGSDLVFNPHKISNLLIWGQGISSWWYTGILIMRLTASFWVHAAVVCIGLLRMWGKRA